MYIQSQSRLQSSEKLGLSQQIATHHTMSDKSLQISLCSASYVSWRDTDIAAGCSLSPGPTAANPLQQHAAAEWCNGQYRLPTGHPAANPPHDATVVDRRDRQTNGRTLYHYTDPATDYASNDNDECCWQVPIPISRQNSVIKNNACFSKLLLAVCQNPTKSLSLRAFRNNIKKVDFSSFCL